MSIEVERVRCLGVTHACLDSLEVDAGTKQLRGLRATDLYQEGVDLPLVSRILGHASMETTKFYAKPSMEMLREAMQAVAPAAEAERPMWEGNEEEMARLCGLR